MIDGKIARRFNLITTVGKVLDPLADKATQFSLTICLAIRYPQLWRIVWLFIAKEVFQLIAGSIRLREGMILKGARISGKICTTILFLSLITMVLVPEVPAKIVNLIVYIDGMFLLVAFVDYIITYFKRDSMFQPLDIKKT